MNEIARETVTEVRAAEILGVDRSTLRQWRAKKWIEDGVVTVTRNRYAHPRANSKVEYSVEALDAISAGRQRLLKPQFDSRQGDWE